jgi:hypothetical protein
MSGYARGEDRKSLIHNLSQFARRHKYPFAQFASKRDLKAISELGCLCFGPSAFSLEKFRSLYQTNSRLLLVVKGEDGILKGYFDIMPVKAAFVEDLKAGRKREIDISPSDIFTEKELKTGDAGSIYLAALVLRSSSQRNKGPDRTFCKLVLAGMERIQQISIANPKLSDLFALAYQETSGVPGPATPYLIRFGFQESGTSQEGYSVHELNSGAHYGGLEEVFSTLSVVRKKHERLNRGKMRLAAGAIFSALLIVVATVLMRKSELTRTFMMELGVGVAAAVIGLILEPFLKLRSLLKE